MDYSSVVAVPAGNHTIDFGFEYRAYRQNKYNGSSTRSGSYVFDTTWTKGPLDNSTASPRGQGMAAYLLGLPTAASLLQRNADLAEQSTLWAGYVQDSWRVHKRLTVTVGLRYELEGPLTERFNRSIRDFDERAPRAAPVGGPLRASGFVHAAGVYPPTRPTPELTPAASKSAVGCFSPGSTGGIPRAQPGSLLQGEIITTGWAGSPFHLWQQTHRGPRRDFGLYFNGLGTAPLSDILQNSFSAPRRYERRPRTLV
jgi:hypothetical protein